MLYSVAFTSFFLFCYLFLLICSSSFAYRYLSLCFKCFSQLLPISLIIVLSPSSLNF